MTVNISENVDNPIPQFKMGSVMKVSYVSLNVSDLRHSLDFYQSVLGFKTIGRPSGDRTLLSADRNDSSFLVELLQGKTSNGKRHAASVAKSAGLYHFAILLPERKHLADMLVNLSHKRDQVYFDGLADHLVSESIYIRDPDFNGIEIYRDRLTTEWRWNGKQIEMATLPLNKNDLLNESTEKGWKEMPVKTTIGHVHLHVSNITRAIAFYQKLLGLNLTATLPSAAFFAAGRYHHHIATNTWLGTGIRQPSSQDIGLNHFAIELSSNDEYSALAKRLSNHGLTMSETPDGSVVIQDVDGIRIRIQHK
jgi:catechol 2,3-dioxygenase